MFATSQFHQRHFMAQQQQPGPAPTPGPAPAPQQGPGPAVPGAAVVGPWYQTIWSQPAVYGVPVVPTLLGLGALAAILVATSAGKKRGRR